MNVAEWIVVAIALLGVISIAGSLGRIAAASEGIASALNKPVAPGDNVVPLSGRSDGSMS